MRQQEHKECRKTRGEAAESWLPADGGSSVEPYEQDGDDEDAGHDDHHHHHSS